MDGQARRDAALLVGHGRPGFYLRVLQEGKVGAGDPITVVHRDPAGLSVRRVSQLLHTGARDDASLPAALAVPALSEGWKWSFRQLLASGDRPAPRAGAAGRGRARVPGVPPVDGDPDGPPAGARRLRPPAPRDGVRPPSRLPGQYVPVRLADDGGAVVRSYSLSAPAGSVVRRMLDVLECRRPPSTSSPSGRRRRRAGSTGRPAHPSSRAASGGPLVTFARAGVSTGSDPSQWSSLLELAEACDVPVRWSCRTGLCHSCETSLVDGAVDHAPEPLEAPGGGLVLVCCARPTAAVILDL